MNYFIYIFSENIMPIFIVISMGYFLKLYFDIDIYTLTKINFYIFVPALVIVEFYKIELKFELINVFIFTFLYVFSLLLLTTIIGRTRKYSSSLRNAFKNVVVFYNCGNYSLPLIVLVFNKSNYAISIQVIVMLAMSFLMYTIGFYNAGRSSMNIKETVKKVFLIPPAHAILLALLLKIIPYDLSQLFFWTSLEYISRGFIPIALLTVGVQLSKSNIDLKNFEIYFATFLRLIIGPIIGYVLIKLLGITGIMAQVLFISSSAPSATNTAIIAAEFKNKPDFSSQVIMSSTILSGITVTFIILLSNILFG